MNKLKPGYKETEVGIIPEDWEVKKILDISVIDKNNLSSTTDKFYEFKYISYPLNEAILL